MRTLNFLFAVFLGRFVRFAALSLLVVRYGPQSIHLISQGIHHHLTLTLTIFAVLVAFFTWLITRQVQASRKDRANQP